MLYSARAVANVVVSTVACTSCTRVEPVLEFQHRSNKLDWTVQDYPFGLLICRLSNESPIANLRRGYRSCTLPQSKWVTSTMSAPTLTIFLRTRLSMLYGYLLDHGFYVSSVEKQHAHRGLPSLTPLRHRVLFCACRFGVDIERTLLATMH